MRMNRTLLSVVAIAVLVVGGFWFVVVFGNYRAAQTYEQQLRRAPRGPWPKESVAEAVVVRLPFPIGQKGEDHEGIAAVGAQLSELLSNSSLGKYDGSECVRNRCALYLYGPDAEALYARVRGVLQASPITANSSVDLRLGPIDSEGMTVAKKGAP